MSLSAEQLASAPVTERDADAARLDSDDAARAAREEKLWQLTFDEAEECSP